jgi:16S rRNA (adenine1518-N6/adenine1519-N6)-dimethyltransferase
LGQLVQLGFASRRKMLRNNLKSFCNAEMVSQALKKLNLSPEVRAEALSLEQWQALCNLLAP